MIFRYKKLFASLALGAALCISSIASAKESWEGYWIPEGVSTYAKDVDGLFYFVLVLTGVVFIATEGCLLLFIIKYRKQEGQKSFYTHGNHTLEMIWTILPAITLIVIALIQARTWNEIKDAKNFADRKPDATIDDYVHVQLFAAQFNWTFRYPVIATDESGKKTYKYGVPGTFTKENELTVPKDKKVIVEMTSRDVIHSFFLPYMRLKQDVVPGMQIRCWFDSHKSTAEMRMDRPKMMLRHPGMYDAKTKIFDTPLQEKEWNFPIVCAELCGIQHYSMAGRVVVLEPKEYDKWYASESKKALAGASPEADIFAKYWQVDSEGRRIYGMNNDGSSVDFPAKNEANYNKRSALKFEEHVEPGGAEGEKK